MRDNSRAYTLTGPGGSFTFDRTDGSVTRLRDIEWEASLNTSMLRRAQGHGAYFDPGFKGAGTLNLTLRLEPRYGTEAEVEAVRSQLVEVLNSIMGSEGTGTLEWTNRGASTPIYLPRVWLFEDPQFKINDGGWDIQIMLASDTPFAEDADATITDSISLATGGGGFAVPLTIPFTLTASGGGSMSVDHIGDFPEAFPALRIYGPATDPHVINQTKNERLVFAGSIASGDYWEINLFNPAVKLNGLTTIRAVVPEESTWFTLGRGTTTLQLSCAGFDATTKLRALMRSTWG